MKAAIFVEVMEEFKIAEEYIFEFCIQGEHWKEQRQMFNLLFLRNALKAVESRWENGPSISGATF